MFSFLLCYRPSLQVYFSLTYEFMLSFYYDSNFDNQKLYQMRYSSATFIIGLLLKITLSI